MELRGSKYKPYIVDLRYFKLKILKYQRFTPLGCKDMHYVLIVQKEKKIKTRNLNKFTHIFLNVQMCFLITIMETIKISIYIK